MSLDMYGAMTGTSAWTMTRTWDLTHAALLFAMWTVRMIGMKLPSAHAGRAHPRVRDPVNRIAADRVDQTSPR